MTTRLVHRPARTTRPLAHTAPRTVEAPPNLPEGKAGGMAQALLPVMGVMSSVVMMAVMRSGQYAAIGAVTLIVTVCSTFGMLFSQRGKAQRTRRSQRERYLEYLERQREELAVEERQLRFQARLLAPPPQALYDLVSDPARLWSAGAPTRTSCKCGWAPANCSCGRSRWPHRFSALTPPDEFMLNEARRCCTASGPPPTCRCRSAGPGLDISVAASGRRCQGRPHAAAHAASRTRRTTFVGSRCRATG